MLTLSTLAAGEKILTTATGRKTRYEPKVTTCEPLCVFKDKTNSWCFYTLDPTLRLGWEWNQIFGTKSFPDLSQENFKYWQLVFAPVGLATGYLEMILNVSRMVYIDFIADLAQFRSRIWASVIFTQKGNLCGGIGWDTQKIDLLLSLQHGFMDCFKSMISNICDPSSNWTGIDAKIFTKCTQSKRVQLSLREWVFQQALTNQLIVGTTDPTSVTYCISLFGTTTATTAKAS